ncbi:uncharacterized protein F5Z01DRAFT_658042 [Emericellopsis atlantica]|uniref:Extracellular serine-rich protein n=1 Tax=Emericellopsis atlantica TaxID=2614577 RepID=A0A9P7ZK33_9HYPO|nr:uncharacterized protein F5Z01DRAFT_658042 [Emericellopsis atlantica]KAG9253176.1 hypothetical protein F5Z01DRAFT_658042 [Emericellopsis atlantica]
MHCTKTFIAAAAMLFSVACADTITITAKADNTFEPNNVQADKGDMVEFRFARGNHSVVTGLYDFPCAPLDMGSGFFSGFMDTMDDQAVSLFRVKINNTEPIAFYSSVDGQCAGGMVGMINADSNHTLDDYRSRAKAVASSISPRNGPYGGEVDDVKDSGDSGDDSNENMDDEENDNSNGNDNSDGKGNGNGNAAGALGVPAASAVMASLGFAALLL